MCEVLDVSRAGYYDWQHRQASERRKRQAELTRKIAFIHGKNRQVYGSPRIHKALLSQQEKVSVNTVASLMKKAGIQAKTHRKFVVTTESRHGFKVAENKLQRNFKPARINQVQQKGHPHI